MEFKESDLDFCVVQAKSVNIPNSIAVKDALDEFCFSGGDVEEPKGVVTVPKEDEFRWGIVYSGSVCKVPVQELLSSCSCDFWESEGGEVVEELWTDGLSKRE